MNNYVKGESIDVRLPPFGRHRAKIVEVVCDDHPTDWVYKVRRNGATFHVMTSDISKVPALEQLAEQALGNKTHNLSGKE